MLTRTACAGGMFPKVGTQSIFRAETVRATDSQISAMHDKELQDLEETLRALDRRRAVLRTTVELLAVEKTDLDDQLERSESQEAFLTLQDQRNQVARRLAAESFTLASVADEVHDVKAMIRRWKHVPDSNASTSSMLSNKNKETQLDVEKPSPAGVRRTLTFATAEAETSEKAWLRTCLNCIMLGTHACVSSFDITTGK